MQHTCSSARDEPLSAFLFAKDLPWFSWDIALGLLVPGVSWGAVSRCPGVLEAPKGHPALEVSAFRMGGKWDEWSPSRAAERGGGGVSGGWLPSEQQESVTNLPVSGKHFMGPLVSQSEHLPH